MDVALDKREQFLKDNCDAVEEVSYTKAFTSAALALQREQLTDASIKIADILEEKKEVMAEYKERMKPLEQMRDKAIQNLKDKSQLVTEQCFKFLDEDTKMIGFYNKEGRLVSSRPAFPKELSPTIFSINRKNGTENQ